MSVNHDRIQSVVVGTAKLLTGLDCLWAPTSYPKRALADVVTARIGRGGLISATTRYPRLEPTKITWTATSVVADQRIGIALTGARFYYDVQAGDDDTDARDAVQALLTPRLLPGVTVTAVGSDAFELDAVGVPGLLWRPVKLGPTASIVIDTEVLTQSETGVADFQIELQAFAAGRSMQAHSILSKIAGGLGLHTVLELQGRLGIVLNDTTDIIDLTAIAGADWESRASMRLRVSARSYQSVATSEVTGVDYTVTPIPLESFSGSVDRP